MFFAGVGAIVVPQGTQVSLAQIRIWKDRVAANGGTLWDCVPPGPGASARGGPAPPTQPPSKRLKSSSSTGSGVGAPGMGPAPRPTHLIVDASLSVVVLERWWRDQVQALARHGVKACVQWRDLVRGVVYLRAAEPEQSALAPKGCGRQSAKGQEGGSCALGGAGWAP